jgi:hypothetical protein
MRTRRVNSLWSSGPAAFAPTPAQPTAFEKLVSRLNLQPEQFTHSEELRRWVNHHRRKRYIPEALLVAYGFVIHD